MRRRTASAAALLLALTPTLSGCGEDEATLQVLAAASLTDAFTRVGERFEALHPDGAEVEFSFGSSTDLAEQAADGAPGDILATADSISMAIASDADAIGPSRVFASNRLVVVTPPSNPAGVDDLTDLIDADWVRCADEVPCGRAALSQLERAGVTAQPVSLEEDVRAALDKVVSGEADAALVYRSDAVAAGDAVRMVEIPGAEVGANLYYVATLHPDDLHPLAADFMEFVLHSQEGRLALLENGFTVAESDPQDPIP